MKPIKILAINPGSTSTKIGVFENEIELFKTNIRHQGKEFAGFSTIPSQKPYRRRLILNELEKHALALGEIDAFVGRGGGLRSIEGGVYTVNRRMLEDVTSEELSFHPASLGSQLAYDMGNEVGKPSFVVNGPSVDEFMDLSRLTGMKGIIRASHTHALNQKEIALRYAAEQGKRYGDLRLIICHLGGGISVTAHLYGRMVDSSDNAYGDGPMAPTRSGTIPAMDMLELSAGGRNYPEIKAQILQTGGWLDHLGTDNALELKERIAGGDIYADLVFKSTMYQVAKWIGAMSIPLKGGVDAIILTGGLTNDQDFTFGIKEYVGHIGPVVLMPGEFELEALAAGVLRVLTNQEQPKEYTGVDVLQDFRKRYGLPISTG